MRGFAMNKIMTAFSALFFVVPLAAVAASDSKSPSAKSGGSNLSDDKRDDGKGRDDKRGHHKPERCGKSKCAGGGSDSR